jgi:twitching motility protein PilT
MPGLGRFRGNIFLQRGSIGLVYRHIPTEVPTLVSLNLPEVINRLADLPRGLVLVTGMTGSGKSTTLAAMVRRILETKPVSVMTVEDPAEFLHSDGIGMVTQREVGCVRTPTYSSSARSAMRPRCVSQ